MTIAERLKRLVGLGQRPLPVEEETPPNLREFIYLDEVSLRSLLSSLRGEVTESTSEQQGSGFQGELVGKMAMGATVVGKAEVTSKYQTSNSSTLQTSRKATVQSWFRELHGFRNVRLVEPTGEVSPLRHQDELSQVRDTNVALPAASLKRGEMVEFRIRLAADYVFHLGTIAEEFAGIAKDFPQIVASPQAKAMLGDTYVVSRLLSRLLAGLIPVRCEALDYVVVEVAGEEYVARRELVKGLGLETRTLELVGVTEHLAYWKDIRRVLFSGAECTMLARVARSRLHDSWTPVKLAELFRPFTPDLVSQITRASRDPFLDGSKKPADEGPNRMKVALKHYANSIVAHLADEQPASRPSPDFLIDALAATDGSAGEQRTAFAVVRDAILKDQDKTIDPDSDLALRNEARTFAGLALLPGSDTEAPAPVVYAGPEQKLPKLLDVEVIAIYW
ncbi:MULTISPECIES: DUF6414 family protein [Sphingomonas]|uniref:DUF6414 family protein n=1 Tax=Sphingomonas TaxID=13687 RepID=UPI000DEED455|nr:MULTISPECIES: hypothetical protein [Sphingomonas]